MSRQAWMMGKMQTNKSKGPTHQSMNTQTNGSSAMRTNSSNACSHNFPAFMIVSTSGTKFEKVAGQVLEVHSYRSCVASPLKPQNKRRKRMIYLSKTGLLAEAQLAEVGATMVAVRSPFEAAMRETAATSYSLFTAMALGERVARAKVEVLKVVGIADVLEKTTSLDEIGMMGVLEVAGFSS